MHVGDSWVLIIHIICSLTLSELCMERKWLERRKEKRKKKKEVLSRNMTGITFFLITFLKAIMKIDLTHHLKKNKIKGRIFSRWRFKMLGFKVPVSLCNLGNLYFLKKVCHQVERKELDKREMQMKNLLEFLLIIPFS